MYLGYKQHPSAILGTMSLSFSECVEEKNHVVHWQAGSRAHYFHSANNTHVTFGCVPAAYCTLLSIDMTFSEV